MVLETLNWLFRGRGLLSFSPAHVGVFLRSQNDLETPDLQFVFTPASYRAGIVGGLHSFAGMTCGVCQMRPESRGFVRINSPNPSQAPVIQPNYLQAEEDREAITAPMTELQALLEGQDTDAIRTLTERLGRQSETFASRRMDKSIREALAGMSLDALDDEVMQ